MAVRRLLCVIIATLGLSESVAGGYGRNLRLSTEPWIEQISWSPRSYVYHNFLSDEDCDHLIKLAKPFMQRSTVVGEKGESVLDTIRTSYGMFLRRLQDPVVTRMEEKLAQWTKLNVSHQEDTQILRYDIGQKYGAHYDSLEDDSPRTATVLVYLVDTDEGGETAFPGGSEWIDPSLEAQLGPFSRCAKGSVAARPRKGDAILFHSLKTDQSVDPAGLHTGCPVVRGTKWTATKWIHTKPFRADLLPDPSPPEPVPYPERCEDLHDQCTDWAKRGECEKNKAFMAGEDGGLGQCRKSCKACEECASDDTPCLSRNRERAGYLPLNPLTGEII